MTPWLIENSLEKGEVSQFYCGEYTKDGALKSTAFQTGTN